MSEDDPIWGNEDQPERAGESYDAMLVDVDDGAKSYGRETIVALSDDEAIAKARKWAWAECERQGIEKARLVLVGGTIGGSYSLLIDRANG